MARKGTTKAAKADATILPAGKTFRVWKLDATTKEAFRDARDRDERTNSEYVHTAITGRLPGLVSALGGLGIRNQDEPGPVRMTMFEDDLQALKVASFSTGIDQQTLFVACLLLEAGFAGGDTAKPKAARKPKTAARKKARKPRIAKDDQESMPDEDISKIA